MSPFPYPQIKLLITKAFIKRLVLQTWMAVQGWVCERGRVHEAYASVGEGKIWGLKNGNCLFLHVLTYRRVLIGYHAFNDKYEWVPLCSFLYYHSVENYIHITARDVKRQRIVHQNWFLYQKYCPCCLLSFCQGTIINSVNCNSKHKQLYP